jgi:hypothetical protein
LNTNIKIFARPEPSAQLKIVKNLKKNNNYTLLTNKRGLLAKIAQDFGTVAAMMMTIIATRIIRQMMINIFF